MKEKSVSTRVSNAIREAIFSSKLRPGEPLLEAHLAEDFQVSQTSVREALLNLERFGLVRRVPNRGTFVTKLSLEDLRERVAVRIPLEEMACIEAARRLTEDHFKKLSERVSAVSTAMSQNAYFDVTVAEFQFHDYVWEHCGNTVLRETLGQLSAPLFAFAAIQESAQRQNLKSRNLASHGEIVSALRGGEPETIRNAVKIHFEDLYAELQNCPLGEPEPSHRFDGAELRQTG